MGTRVSITQIFKWRAGSAPPLGDLSGNCDQSDSFRTAHSRFELVSGRPLGYWRRWRATVNAGLKWLSRPVGYNQPRDACSRHQPVLDHHLRCDMSLRRLGILCGILAPLLWLSLIALAGATRPGFSHVTHYISELGERGSSTEVLVRYAAFGFTGFLYVCFAAALLATFRDGWSPALAAALIGLDGLGRLGAGVFACDPGCTGLSSSQELHHLFATVGFSSGILAAIAWGLSVQRRGWPKLFTWYSVGTGMLALTFLLLMSWSRNPLHAPGLYEHLATGVLSLWLLVFAARLMRPPAPGARST